MKRAIDVSNYSATPTDDQCRCIMNAGYTIAIVGSSYGTVADSQLAAFERNGFDTAEYQFPQQLRVTTRPWWLDVESPPGTTVDEIRSICRGQPPFTKPIGIYTSRSMWHAITSDWNIVAEFPELKLFDASYGDPPPAFVPYGGWTSRAMHQWHDTTDLCGMSVDLDIVEEEQRMYTDAEIDQKFRDVETVIKLNHDELAQKLAAIESKLAKLTIALQAAASAAGT